jgi:radical SAM-linked protein
VIALKYQKTGSAALAGHVDTLRTLTAIFRRAELDVEYSVGFNPHMEINLSAALSLGTQSLCEYVTIKAPYIDDILVRLNAVSPPGIVFVKAQEITTAHIDGVINSARYTVKSAGIANYAEELATKPLLIPFLGKNGEAIVDVADKILSVSVVDNDTITLKLATGYTNLRPDRLIAGLLKKHNSDADYDILRTASYVGDVDMDTHLDRLSALVNK